MALLPNLGQVMSANRPINPGRGIGKGPKIGPKKLNPKIARGALIAALGPGASKGGPRGL